MLARNGFTTYATMRNLAKSSELRIIAEKEALPLKIVQLDVTDDNSVKNAIKLIIEQSNRLDVLVNNAGYGLSGALEDFDIDEIKSQYETNVFGLIRTTQVCSSNNEKTNVRNNCKYKLWSWKIWYCYLLCICKYKICNRRIK